MGIKSGSPQKAGNIFGFAFSKAERHALNKTLPWLSHVVAGPGKLVWNPQGGGPF